TFGGAAVSGVQWSPDGKWVSYTKSDKTLLPHVYIIAATGGQERRVTGPDSYSDMGAHWTPDGKRLVYLSGVDSGNIGQTGRSTAQLWSVMLATEDKDPADRGVDSEAAAAEADRPARPAGRPDTRPEVKIDFDRLERRARQLTRSGDAIREVAVAPDSRSVAFVTGGVEGGRQVQSIWSVTFEGERVTRLQQSTSQADEEGAPPAAFGRGGVGYSSLQYAKDGRTLFYRQNRGIYALPISAAPAASPQAVAAAGGFGGRGGRGGRGAPGGGGAAVAAGDTPTSTARRVTFSAKVE